MELAYSPETDRARSPQTNRARSPETNRLLAALPAEEYARLAPHLQARRLCYGELLHGAHAPLTHAYFPRAGILSWVLVLADGATIEVAMIGCEGMVGGPALDEIPAPYDVRVQVPGHGVQIPVAALLQFATSAPMLARLLWRYSDALLVANGYLAACNRLHDTMARCARWLLQASDRVGSNQFPLTHEFLATMLAVRRATVTEVAGTLQEAGLIHYRRGQMTIVSRAGLEATACECYAGMRDALEAVYA